MGESSVLQFDAAIGRGDNLGVVRGEDHGRAVVAGLSEQLEKPILLWLCVRSLT